MYIAKKKAVFFNLFNKERQGKPVASEDEKAPLASIFRKEADKRHKVKPVETEVKELFHLLIERESTRRLSRMS